ncbi:MAG: hypothetical protein ABIZ80_17775 [Bryobacteraceae bacterium]
MGDKAVLRGLRGRSHLWIDEELLNKTTFGQPGATRGTPAFGVISSARDARRVQLALRVTF